MGNPFTADWYRSTYQVLLYLEEVYDCLLKDPAAVSIPKNNGFGWGIEEREVEFGADAST